VVLGLQALIRHTPRDAGSIRTAPLPQPGVSSYGRGLLNNLLNPKIGVFYSAFLPQFIAPGQPVFLMSVTLASIHAVLGILWLLLYATVLIKLGDLVRRPQIHQAMERITGVVLIGLGLRLATEQR
jgi:threonine/homoserine/homoserine lactone efflux protein